VMVQINVDVCSPHWHHRVNVAKYSRKTFPPVVVRYPAPADQASEWPYRLLIAIGRVSYIRIYLCYFCFRWKTVSLVQTSLQYLIHHVTV